MRVAGDKKKFYGVIRVNFTSCFYIFDVGIITNNVRRTLSNITKVTIK